MKEAVFDQDPYVEGKMGFQTARQDDQYEERSELEKHRAYLDVTGNSV